METKASDLQTPRKSPQEVQRSLQKTLDQLEETANRLNSLELYESPLWDFLLESKRELERELESLEETL